MTDPEIVDVEFEVVTPGRQQLPTPPKPRASFRAVVARCFCAAVIGFAGWDILSDGAPTKAGKAWLDAQPWADANPKWLQVLNYAVEQR